MAAPHPLQEILAKSLEDAGSRQSPLLESEGPRPAAPATSTVVVVRPKTVT